MTALSTNYPHAHDVLHALPKCLDDLGCRRHRGRSSLVHWVCDWATLPTLSMTAPFVPRAKSPVNDEYLHSKWMCGAGCVQTAVVAPATLDVPTSCWSSELQCETWAISVEKEELHRKAAVKSLVPEGAWSWESAGQYTLCDVRQGSRHLFAARILRLIASQTTAENKSWNDVNPCPPGHLEACMVSADTAAHPEVAESRNAFVAQGATSMGYQAMLHGQHEECMVPCLQRDLLEWMMTSSSLNAVVRWFSTPLRGMSRFSCENYIFW